MKEVKITSYCHVQYEPHMGQYAAFSREDRKSYGSTESTAIKNFIENNWEYVSIEVAASPHEV